MSKENNGNLNMTPQPQKRDNRVVVLLSVILVVLFAIVIAIVAITVSMKNKEIRDSAEEVLGFGKPTQSTTQYIAEGDKNIKPPSGQSGTSADTNSANPTVSEKTENNQTNSPSVPSETKPAQSTKPANGVETLNYFNTAINKVKTGASSVEQKKVENYLANSPIIPSSLQNVYKMLGGDSWLDKTLKDNSQGATTLKGGDIKAKFPVEGESYASRLQSSDIKSATCTESNGIYTITITTVADAKSPSHKHGAGHNPKALNVILPGTVNDNIPGAAKSLVGEATMSYPSSTITITVDAKTGNVLTANYDLKWTISFTKMDASIPLGTRSSYKINW